MNQNAAQQAGPEHWTFYCQVDTYLARKDYLRAGRCVRFVGVEQHDYDRLMQGEYEKGVRTFVVDVDISSFLKSAHSKIWKMENRFHADMLAFLELELNDGPVWFKVTAEASKTGRSYFYSTFSASLPTFLAARSVKRTSVPNLRAQPALSHELSGFLEAKGAHRLAKLANSYGELQFSAFHVGQGMCSMVHDMRHGVMFDAGAGKPVTRERYLAGLGKNELRTLVTGLNSIPYFVLSHFDADHWNMLAWDKELRDKVEAILVPKVSNRSARSVAFFDVEVLDRVEETETAWIPLGGGSTVESRRSQPSFSDSNGNALVSVVDIEGRRVLVSGDYVYSRMLTDTDPAIGAWATGPYSAVMVPHHGDEASAAKVPSCARGGKAFFSAGTHETWCHPRKVSIVNHEARGYEAIRRKTEKNIIRRVLI